jgi:hypothetical protein
LIIKKSYLLQQSLNLLIPGTATLNFNFEQFSTKAEILSAINNLPAIRGSPGTDVAAAINLMEPLFRACPLRTFSQCRALVLFDADADDINAVNIASSVSVVRWQISNKTVSSE